MSIYARVFADAADGVRSGPSSSYSAARAATTAFNLTAANAIVGQDFSGGLYQCSQYLGVFDTSSVSGSSAGTLSVSLTTAATTAGDTIEVRACSGVTNMVAGDAIAALVPLYGSLAMPATTGRKSIALDITSMPRASGTQMLLSSQKQRTNTAPTTATEMVGFGVAETTGTTSDPYIDFAGGWSFVGVSAVVETLTTSLPLTEPAGVAAGDLMVACIGGRGYALGAAWCGVPAGWTAIDGIGQNSTSATGSGLANARTMYCVRGASAPTLTFTLTGTANVALGRIVAYRGVAATTPLDANGGGATAASILNVSVAGLTTTQDDDLIVAMAAGGQEAAWSAFTNVTTPLTASGATDTTTAPSPTAWIERADSLTTNGADTSLAIFDAVRTTAGATGNLTVTASVGAGQVVLASAFKIQPYAETTAWSPVDKTAAITLSAANKTATLSSGSTSAVRSAKARLNGAPGKYYAEMLVNAFSVGMRLGMQEATGVLANDASQSVNVASNGAIRVNGSTIGASASGFTTNDVVCISWDASTERIWFRTNSGLWNNDASADPATNTNGVDASVFAAANICLRLNSFTAADSITIRTEAAEFTQAVPSGFLSWMGETPVVGGGVTVNATGVAAGTALGTVTVSAVAPVSFEAVGVAATTALGTATATGRTNISTEAIGVAAVALLGSATATAVWNVSATSASVTAGTALGTATATGVASVSTTPLGQTAATALGNVSVAAGGAVSVIPAGVTATALTGTATVTAKISVNVTPTGVSAAAVTASGATAPSSSLIASFTPGPNRNDFTGEVGVRWGIGAADIPITWMGMYVTTTGGSRTVRLYEWFGDTVLRTVVFDFSGKTPGTWVWQPITPITLTAGGYYSALHSVTASDGLAWADALAPGAVTSVAGIVNTYATYRAGGAQQAYAADIEYVGLDLGSGASGAGGVVVTIASTAQATGAAAATALGTATVTANRSASFTPTGVTAGTALGGVSIAVGGGISITPSSLAVTAVTGTATVAAQQQVSTLAAGASATALSGTAGVSIRTSTVATGVAATAVVGTATVTAKQAVSTTATGVTASTLLGGVSVSAGGSVSVAAAGQSATALTGTATVTAKRFVSTAATGVTAASALGIATATGTIVVAANTVGVWTGTAWTQKPAKVWTGSAWMAKPVKTWNGGAWV